MCYIVYLRLKFIHVVRIGGGTFVMLIEMLLMLAALVFSAVVLARQLQEKRKRVEPI